MDLQYTQPKNFYQVVQELEKFNQRVGKLKEDYSKELNLDPIAMSDFRILFLNNIQGEILGYRGVLRLYIYAYENSGKNSEKLNKVLDIVLLKQITEECRDEENQKAISDYLKLNLLTSICFCIEVFFSKINKIFWFYEFLNG